MALLLTGLLPACDDDVQPDEVPVEVRQALLDAFPNSSYIEWDKNGKDYEADFQLDRRTHTALLNPTGSLLMHKQAIPETELPGEVTATLNQNFKGYALDEVEKLLKDEGTFYQVELESATSEEQLVLQPNGQPAQLPFWD